jgi:anti-anti-sigma factor
MHSAWKAAIEGRIASTAVTWSTKVLENGDGEPLVVIEGEIDHPGLDAMTTTLVDAGDRSGSVVHVDLAEVRFLSSAGLHALIEAQRQLSVEDKRVQIDAASRIVARVIDIAMLTNYFGM